MHLKKPKPAFSNHHLNIIITIRTTRRDTMQVLRALKTAGQFNLAQGIKKNRRNERKTFLQKKQLAQMKW